MKIAGFDWDDGNWPKCGKHGVTREENRAGVHGTPAVQPDPFPDLELAYALPSVKQRRGRYVFVVFTPRQVEGCPGCARSAPANMHQKEIDHDERQN